MAFITLNKQKLRDNYENLKTLFSKNDIEWAVVAKVFCGNRKYLEALVDLGLQQICDSRIENLKTIKQLAPDLETIFIKPPAKRNVENIVAFADISFNTEYETIKLLSEAAEGLNKVHKIIIMIELGELREGVMREQFVSFYETVFELPNIEVIGIGTNLTCMYGILPSHDKLIQLSLYKQIVEARFDRKIPFISGGASVTIPLIERGLIPAGVNHFRVGETLFLGTDVYNNQAYEHLHNDVFRLYAEIIELCEKPIIPDGELGQNLTGHTHSFDGALSGTTTLRAIVDLGLLDVENGHIMVTDESMKITGASSDMLVIDIGENITNLAVGDLIEFSMDYMGLLRLMNSEYVDKRFEKTELCRTFSEQIDWSSELANVN